MISDEELAKLFIVVLNTLTTVVPNTGTASTQETLQEAAVEADDDSEDEDDAGNSDNELCLVVNEGEYFGNISLLYNRVYSFVLVVNVKVSIFGNISLLYNGVYSFVFMSCNVQLSRKC